MRKDKNYFSFGYFGLANVWVLWMEPLYLTIVLGLHFMGYEKAGNFMAVFLIFLAGCLDVFLRLKTKKLTDKSNGFTYKITLFDRLTIPKVGYIFHFFIFPFPLWIVAFGVVISIVTSLYKF